MAIFLSWILSTTWHVCFTKREEERKRVGWVDVRKEDGRGREESKGGGEGKKGEEREEFIISNCLKYCVLIIWLKKPFLTPKILPSFNRVRPENSTVLSLFFTLLGETDKGDQSLIILEIVYLSIYKNHK